MFESTLSSGMFFHLVDSMFLLCQIDILSIFLIVMALMSKPIYRHCSSLSLSLIVKSESGETRKPSFTTVQSTSIVRLNLHPNSPNTQLGVNRLLLKKMMPTETKREVPHTADEIPFDLLACIISATARLTTSIAIDVLSRLELM